MFPSLDLVDATLTDLLDDLDPNIVDGTTAALLVERFARIERLAAAGKTLMIGRVAETGSWKQSGQRSAAHWLAKVAGCSLRDAHEALKVARKLDDCPLTDEAMRAGDLSTEQAASITDAAADDPETEQELLGHAASDPLDRFRGRCRKAKQAPTVEDDRAKRDRQRALRRFRSWIDDEGMGNVNARLTPADFAEFMSVLAPFTERAFRTARADGRREPVEAYAADGLVDMARAANTQRSTPPTTTHGRPSPPGDADDPDGSQPEAAGDTHRPDPAPTSRTRGKRSRGRRSRRADTTVIVRIDHSALFRGWAADGETCEIAGVGSVPVSVVRELIEQGDPFLAAVMTDGVDVHTVAHLGRRPTARQQTALWWRDPECCVVGCTRTVRLQVDHRTGWARTRRTEVPDLDRLCPYHHALKTNDGWRLEPGTGKRRFLPPDTPDPPRRDTPPPRRAGRPRGEPRSSPRPKPPPPSPAPTLFASVE